MSNHKAEVKQESEVKRAAEQANVQELEKNLQNRSESHHDDKSTNKDTGRIDEPAELSDSQKTPFIDEQSRTDK